MNIEPAHIDQIRQTDEGDYIIISADTSSAVADLQSIDKSLQVRLAGLKTSTPHFVVFHVKVEGDTTTHSLVTTCQAYQNSFGAYEGPLDALVERIRQINPENGYDYVKELDRREAARKVKKKNDFEEKMGPIGEKAAWALRKDLHRMNRRAFIRQGIPQ